MPVLAKSRFFLVGFTFIALVVSQTAARAAQAQAKSQKQTPSKTQQVEPQGESAPTQAEAEQEAEEEMATAAVELDVSKDSPLIQALYRATRETKDKAILADLAQAKTLAKSADVKATDAQGRTALHWAVFGSSYNPNQKVVVAYEQIADTLITRGVDINKEDVYNDTALDYLLYSPNWEMQTLLIENGASSGFLSAFYKFFGQSSSGVPQSHSAAVNLSRQADLTPGATLSIRLSGPVYSDRSRTGDPIEATVTYPLCKNGEQVACNKGELLVPPGTKLKGTVLYAHKAPDKYSQPRLVLDFSDIVHKNGQKSPVYARVLDVDNARETVRNNEILGIVQPHASKKVSLTVAALSASNPIAGYSIKGIQTIYGLSIRREVYFPAGTDLHIQVLRPSMLAQKDSWPGWQQLPVNDQLRELVEKAPLRVYTPKNVPSDLTNLMFLGTQQQLESAFAEAGWYEADNVQVASALKAAQATIRQTGYSGGPVSTLLLEGRPPDLVFQKSLDTFAKRHHIRIWKLSSKYAGQQVWVGAATHDIATTNAAGKTKWGHRIDPHVDRERDWIATDLLFVGTAKAYADIDRPQAPRETANATGDDILTDGKMSVVKLAGASLTQQAASTPELKPRPAKQ
jgi:hypothetical protein